MVSPYEMQGRKRDKYGNGVEEPDPETAVEEAEEEGLESRKMVVKSVGTGTDFVSFPLVELGQSSVNNRSEDRISKLPDDILVDILSNLELREAAKSSLLSRRWLNLWTLVQRLCFDATEDQRKFLFVDDWIQDRPVFVNWVNHVIVSGLHKSPYLRVFRIWFVLDNRCQNEIDRWLEYAFGRGVESLELNFSRTPVSIAPIHGNYSLTNQLLERIALKDGFSCVRALCFSDVNITGEAIEFLLRKCPLLEDLRVMGSDVLVNVVVSGPSLLLKHLQITDYDQFKSITISDTNIVSLRVSTRKEVHLLLNNLPMLTDVWIFQQFSNKTVFFAQLSCLSQLTVLTLQAVSPKAFMGLYKFPELKNLRRLVLVVRYCIVNKSLIGLTSSIDSCPRLEEFALGFCAPAEFVDISTIEQKKATNQSLKCLKVFELQGYFAHRAGYAFESEMIMFFIENAVALEKIVIDPCRVTIRHGRRPVETDEQAMENRRHAIEKFNCVVVPKHVRLVIL